MRNGSQPRRGGVFLGDRRKQKLDIYLRKRFYRYDHQTETRIAAIESTHPA